MKYNLLFLTIAFFASALFLACGDDSSTTIVDDYSIKKYESFEDMPHCTKSYYGKVFYVEDKETYFECTSKDWVELDSSAVDSLLESLEKK